MNHRPFVCQSHLSPFCWLDRVLVLIYRIIIVAYNDKVECHHSMQLGLTPNRTDGL